MKGPMGLTEPMRLLAAMGCLASVLCLGASADPPRLSGVVMDATRSPIPGASISVRNSFGTLIRQSNTDGAGRFEFLGLVPGSYTLIAEAADFERRSLAVAATPSRAPDLEIELSVTPVSSEIVVTATRSLVEDAKSAGPLAARIDREEFLERGASDLGAAIDGSPSVMVQQTTPGQTSPFLRGLTGYQTLILVDGVRFNTSMFRSGPNQYLAYVEPGQAEAVETVLGPAAAAYGSDSLGGTIQVLTRQLGFNPRPRAVVHGDLSLTGATADLSGASRAQMSISTARVAWLGGASWGRHNDLRAGAGADSRNVFARYFGLSPSQVRGLLGGRLVDTAFGQLAAHTKLAVRPSASQSLTLWYQRTGFRGLRSYRDLLGGLGRLQAVLEPQQLNLFYARYEKLNPGPLDSLTSTFSINSQRDDSVRQGPRFTDAITRDGNRVDAFGYSAQATGHAGEHQVYVFGAEVYQERVLSQRTEQDPVSGRSARRRALYPDHSHYTTLGLFVQDSLALFTDRVRVNLGGRLTAVRFRTFADRNPGLGVVDCSRTFRDLTFHAGINWRATRAFGLSASTGRGFRAPNLNDLGAIGLTGLGFEVPAEQAMAAGALLAADAGEGALPASRPLGKLGAETMRNNELGLRLETGKLYTRLQLFDSELGNPIVRRTMLFPAAQPPAAVAGFPVTVIPPTEAQRAAGVVTVATSQDPRAVKAFVNDGRTRYYGLEAVMQYALSPRWSASGNYSFLVGRDLDPNRPVRRLPPQQGVARVRYLPARTRLWVEMGVRFAGRQMRLAAGDLDDERIGASRRRSDIAAFFRSGVASPWLLAGSDGRLGTADDLFAPTGETLRQIQDRVLPLGALANGVRIVNDNSRVPMFSHTPSWVSVDLRGGLELGRGWSLAFGLTNALDRNYRLHGSGTDAPGRSAVAIARYVF